jgi:membrane-associated phospholipid phosphatase
VDEDVRQALQLPTYQQRRTARDLSDVLLSWSVMHPTVVDGFVVSSWYHRADDVTEQMVLINIEVLSITIAVQGVVAGVASRERPYGRDCGNQLDEDIRDCRRNNRHRSFFSGHSAASFASAGLICSHHANLPLYGGGFADGAICGAAFAVAGATAGLRVVSDMHYTSDVLVGAAWGTLTGLSLPWLLHYRHGSEPRPQPSELRLHVVPLPGGLGVGGSF